MKKPNGIWLIGVFENLRKSEVDNLLRNDDFRVWGYFFDEKEALMALHENWGDMWEGIYDHAILEFAEEGICPMCHPRQFFKFDAEKGGFFEIEEPDGAEHMVNFTIG